MTTISKQDSHRPIIVIEDHDPDFEIFRLAAEDTGISNPLVHIPTADGLVESLRDKIGPDKVTPLLILLDLNLPGMDGKTCLKDLKAAEELRSIPVIVFSNSAHDQEVKACYQLGASSYFQKPVSFEATITLMRCLQEYWLQRAELPR